MENSTTLAPISAIFQAISGGDFWRFPVVLGTDSARALSCVGLYYDLKIFTLDFEYFHLTGSLDHDVYMEQAPGYEVTRQGDLVCLLKESLSGLTESGQCA